MKTMPWPEKKKTDDKGKLYLNVGEMIRVQFKDDEPELYYTHYVNGKSSRCEGQGCVNCERGEKLNTKGTITVVDMSDGKEKNSPAQPPYFGLSKRLWTFAAGSRGLSLTSKPPGKSGNGGTTLSQCRWG